MIIIGAGLSGLLCGALNPCSIIYESGPKRESEHKALFRCKTGQIGKVLGIDFKKVNVHKAIWFEDKEVQPSPRLAHMYSRKVTGKITGRSILNIDPCIRYIPPADFVDQLISRCNIKWDYAWTAPILGEENIVSTIPMPRILELLKYEQECGFDAMPIYVNRIPIKNCNSYCTVYYPDPLLNSYRASITGDTLIVEGMGKLMDKELNQICDSLGIDFSRTMMNHVFNHVQKLGKIIPIDNTLREKAITDMTLNYNVYSLGRFATWRPKVMLDDVLEDIYHIRKLIQGGKYAALKHQQNEEN